MRSASPSPPSLPVQETHTEEPAIRRRFAGAWYDWALAGLSLRGPRLRRGPLPEAEPRLATAVTPERSAISVLITALTLAGVRRTIGWVAGSDPARDRRLRVGWHLVPGNLRTREVSTANMLNYLNLDNNGLLG